jgi:ribosomal protein RSM22 (predicted rRNA methylase)
MLPPELATGIAAASQGVSARLLARSAQTLSAQYRGAAQGRRRAVQSGTDVLAYVTFRLPATYAATKAALLATAERLPEWRPRSVLDLGSGPGTAMWAAAAVWPSVERFMLVESDAQMSEMGKRLAAASSRPAIRDARWRMADVTTAPELPACDLVIAAYSLGELAAERQQAAVRWLWNLGGGAAVIVEPGTPRGFATVRAARDLLRDAGGTIVAPCPHQGACPMTGAAWCHFAMRLERSRLHRAVKGSQLSYEDEKYSYISVSRSLGLPFDARVIGHPRAGHGHVELELCTPDGLRHVTVSRRKRELYRLAQRARWGSALLQPDEEPGGE